MTAILESYLRRRYALLFYSLLVTIACGPLLVALGLKGNVVEILFAANLLAAVAPIRERGRRATLLAIFLAAGAVRLATIWLGLPQVGAASLAVWTLVATVAAVSALRFTMRAPSIHAEHIYAALSAYVLAGIFFGVLYRAVDVTWPGSFATPDGAAGEPISVNAAIYFSFVTLATLGYGDVLPRSDAARGLAILEAVAGQLYLAVMVARLVTLYRDRGAAS